jgi:hypothetical protein
MPTRNVVLTKLQEEQLKAAARAGIGALDRGEFKEFADVEELQTYLNGISKKIISRTVRKIGAVGLKGNMTSDRR